MKVVSEQKWFVYKFLGKQDEVLYIGKTKNLKNRIGQQHFTLTGHLDKYVYLATEKVYCSELVSHEEMDIYERYLVNTLNPIYNTQMNNNNKFRFTLPELHWQELKFNKGKLIKQIEAQKQNEENEANINVDIDNFTKEGYVLINNENTRIFNLKRLKRKVYGGIEKVEVAKKNPYCRYILVNHNRWFCFADIESVISSSFDTGRTTLSLIQNGVIDEKDILILIDTTLKGKQVRYGTKLRFGSESWLENRILYQVEVNSHKREFKSERGWTKDLAFLYCKVLKKHIVEAAQQN